MKIIFGLMAIYLILLSILPCMDAQKGIYQNGQDVVVSLNIAGQDHQHTTSDACSPFCICTCCTASAFFQPRMGINFFRKPIGVAYALFNSRLDSFHEPSIWQPPQLS